MMGFVASGVARRIGSPRPDAMIPGVRLEFGAGQPPLVEPPRPTIRTRDARRRAPFRARTSLLAVLWTGTFTAQDVPRKATSEMERATFFSPDVKAGQEASMSYTNLMAQFLEHREKQQSAASGF